MADPRVRHAASTSTRPLPPFDRAQSNRGPRQGCKSGQGASAVSLVGSLAFFGSASACYMKQIRQGALQRLLTKPNIRAGVAPSTKPGIQGIGAWCSA